MFGRFNRFNTKGSKRNASESAFCCAPFAFLLLVIDAALAGSIFVCADILGVLPAILVSVLVSLIILRVLLITGFIPRRPALSAA